MTRRPSVTGARPRSLVSTPFVMVPANVAALLEHHLPLTDLRARVRGHDPVIDDALLGIRVAAMTYTETYRARIDAAAAGVGSTVAPTPEVPAKWITTREAADAVGCTNRAVRLAASEGRLHGEKDAEGRWHFSTEQVAAYAATRTRK